MLVKLVWPDCDLINDTSAKQPIDSYWVECTPEEEIKMDTYIMVSSSRSHKDGTCTTI